MLSGLPGAGQDTWIANHAGDVPVVSLEAIRETVGAAPTGGQGAVVHHAREQARALRREHHDFVWNATNLSRDIHGQLIDLFTNYGLRLRIVYVEASADRLFAQNRNRAAALPEEALVRLMDRLEVPDPTAGEHCRMVD